jgi:hypothetical protein
MENFQANYDKILRYLYENGTIDTIGVDVYLIGKELGITNHLTEIAEALVKDGCAKFFSGSKLKITYSGIKQFELVMDTDRSVQENIHNRKMVLNSLYEIYKSGDIYIEIDHLREKLGFEDQTIKSIVKYYTHEKLIEQKGLGGPYKLSNNGIREVERNRD